MAQLLEPAGSNVDQAEIAMMLDQFQRDVSYLDEHWNEWLADYPDCWVVVYGEKLLCYADTLEQVLDDAKAQGVPLRRAAIEFLAANPRGLLL